MFVGHDWAEAHHDVFIEDDDGKRLGGAGFPKGSRASPGCMSWSLRMSRTRPR